MSADQQSTQFVLVKFHKNHYNGENAEHSLIALEGFAVISKSNWQKHLQDIEKISWPQSKFIFGMTNPVRWNSKQEYVSCFDTVDISQSDYEVFRKLFVLASSSNLIIFGNFASLLEKVPG